MLYKVLRFFLSFLGAELQNKILLAIFCFAGRYKYLRPLVRMVYNRTDPSLQRNVFGLNFKNPVGLSAGIDPDGKYCRQFSDFGFGFIEIGSVTPLPQVGNPQPRLFYLPKDKAVISRMGHNNQGVMNLINNLKISHPSSIIVANIGKNSISESDRIVKDYGYCFSMLYDFVDMFVVSIACTVNDGQPDISYLSEIIDELLTTRMTLDRYKPVLLKISPDLGHSQIDEILDYAQISGIDGIVAGGFTNTRENLATSAKKLENIGTGGLSGAPLFPKSLALVKYVHEKTKGRLPIIGCGGIMTSKDAKEMLNAGASLVEIGTGFMYKGPSIVKRINKQLIPKNA